MIASHEIIVSIDSSHARRGHEPELARRVELRDDSLYHPL